MMKFAGKIAVAAGVAAAAAAAANAAKKSQEKKHCQQVANAVSQRSYGQMQAYFVGGGLASLAGAAYLLRDCAFPGNNIHILEGLPLLGGSNDGSGHPQEGFLVRGGRMLNEETYENFWELFSTIPSLEQPQLSVTQEILNFDHAHPTHAQARLVDGEGNILDVTSMGFDNADRLALGKLMLTPEEELDNLRIIDWFRETPHFFETNFWYMWQTTFAFQKWSSLFEFKRYMERMIFEFSRIETLEGVTRTRYNQYESVILPLKQYLQDRGVSFRTGCTVTDIDFLEGEGITASAIHLTQDGVDQVITLNPQDLCFVTNGCMTDSATLGDLHTPAPQPPETSISGDLWAKLAAKKPGLGNPAPFFGKPEETKWQSFTVTMKGNKLLKLIENFSGNIPGSGALMTFRDSSWLMSIVVAAQPHFKNQPMDTTIFWGYGLYPDKKGDYVDKTMEECSGQEILTELLHHLHMEGQLEEIMSTVVNVIPCRMPFIDAQFQPRAMSDRPAVVPQGSTNFAMISQFVEIPQDMVFTEEYSVRAARIAVYTLMDIDLPICPVTPYHKDPKVLMTALKTSYR